MWVPTVQWTRTHHKQPNNAQALATVITSKDVDKSDRSAGAFVHSGPHSWPHNWPHNWPHYMLVNHEDREHAPHTWADTWRTRLAAWLGTLRGGLADVNTAGHAA